MSIVLQSSGGGSVTINEPATASNFTATLPAATGTVQVSGNMPAFYVTLGSNQILTSNTTTKLQFNTETFDTANAFDSTTNYRFTPQVAGYYQINLNQEYSNTTTGNQQVTIQKNGTRIASGGSPNVVNGGTFMASCSVLCFLNGSTDYLEAFGYINAGGTAFSGSSSQFSGSLVRTS